MVTTIYVASEMKRGTCAFDVIAAHERLHLKVHQDRAAQRLKALVDSIDKQMPSPTTQMWNCEHGAGEKWLISQIQPLGKDMQEKLALDIRNDDRELDMSGEGPRIETHCR